VVECWSSVLHSFDPSREEEERENPYTEIKSRNCSLQLWISPECFHLLIKTSLTHNEEEGVSISAAHHDVGIPVQELDTFLQTPEAALHAAQQKFGKLILSTWEDQGSKSQGACVVSTQREGREDGISRNVIWLLEGPVIGSKICTPEEEEDVIELKQDEVSVVQRLTTIKSKQALCIRALDGNIGCVECLGEEKQKRQINAEIVFLLKGHLFIVSPHCCAFKKGIGL
uniref:Uncharacterized protein n=1 Tax=Cyprinodon variegatus TaxID=28743 RepID=A0A3Q2CU93_CYPVA